MRRPRRHAVLASLALLVFLPAGVPALVASFGVDDAFLSGDMRLARRRSRSALAWGLVGVVLAPVLAAALGMAAFTALSEAWSSTAASLRQAVPGSSLVVPSQGTGDQLLPGGTQDQLLTGLGLSPGTGQGTPSGPPMSDQDLRQLLGVLSGLLSPAGSDRQSG